jgi:hypothetical protein
VQGDLRQLAQAFVTWVSGPTGGMIFAAVPVDPAAADQATQIARAAARAGVFVARRAAT